MEWKSKALAELVESLHQGLNTAGEKIKFVDSGYPIIQTRNIDNGKINLDHKIKFMTEDDWNKYKEKYKPQVGDVFFTNIGTIGKTAIVNALDDYLIHWNIFKIRPVADKLISAYLKYRLDYLTNSGFFTNSQKGGTVSFVTKKMMSSIDIPLPPIPEQKRIVAMLDTVFADLEQTRAKTEQNLKNARELFDSYLQQVFSQKGEGWVDSTLIDIAENLDSKRIPITKRDRTEGEYPYYGASGIVDYVDDYIFDEDLLLVSEDGANLLARTYPIAFSASGKYWVNNHAHVLRFKNKYFQKFIEYYLNSISLVPYVTGMAQPKLNQKSLNSIPVPKVNVEISEKVVSQLESLEKEILKIEKIYKFKLASLDELKKSILQKAFSGELTTTAK